MVAEVAARGDVARGHLDARAQRLQDAAAHKVFHGVVAKQAMWPGPLAGRDSWQHGCREAARALGRQGVEVGQPRRLQLGLAVSGCGAPPRPSTTSISMRVGDGRAISSRKGRSIKVVSGFFGYAQNDSAATPGATVMLRPVRQCGYAQNGSDATRMTAMLRPVWQGCCARSGRATTPGPTVMLRPVRQGGHAR